MSQYRCRVLDSNSQIEEIVLDSTTTESLKTEILARGLTLLSFSKGKPGNRSKLKANDLLTFTKTLNLLLNSNMSLSSAIEIAGNTFRQRKLVDFTTKLYKGLQKGYSLVDLLNESETEFPPIYIGLIRVGEKSGDLKFVINQLTTYLEREKKFKDKITGAMVYPLFIISITIIFSLLFVFVILPQFNEMFRSLGGDMSSVLAERGSILTKIVVSFTSLFLGGITYFKFFKSTYRDKLLLKIPVLGKVILERESFNLVFALTVLTRSSLKMEDSLEITKDVINNSYLKDVIVDIKSGIIRGESLSECFDRSPFPVDVSSFIRVGEETGNISIIFSDLTTYYSEHINTRIDKLMSLIDPVFTLLTGAALLTLIIMFILPVLTRMGGLL